MPSKGRYKHYRFSEDEILTAVKGSGGFVTEIARRLGCSRSTVYDYKRRFASISDAIFEEKEGLLDTAESALLSQIGKGNIAAIIYYLKTQGRARGYNERQVLDITARNEGAKGRDEDAEKDAAYVNKVMAELDKLGLTPADPEMPKITPRLDEAPLP